MGFFSSDSDHAQAYGDIYQGGDANKSSWTHEAVGGAAAFEAARLYEQKVAKDGKPDNHALAKELIAGIAGAEVDKLFETKGLDFLDKEKAKYHAKKEAEAAVSADY